MCLGTVKLESDTQVEFISSDGNVLLVRLADPSAALRNLTLKLKMTTVSSGSPTAIGTVVPSDLSPSDGDRGVGQPVDNSPRPASRLPVLVPPNL